MRGSIASAFQVVEVNFTFYRLPEASAFRSWARQSPDDFVFVVKASRFLTHMKKLKDPEEPVERLMSRARELGPKLGGVLLQLPEGDVYVFFNNDFHRCALRDAGWFAEAAARLGLAPTRVPPPESIQVG